MAVLMSARIPDLSAGSPLIKGPVHVFPSSISGSLSRLVLYSSARSAEQRYPCGMSVDPMDRPTTVALWVWFRWLCSVIGLLLLVLLGFHARTWGLQLREAIQHVGTSSIGGADRVQALLTEGSLWVLPLLVHSVVWFVYLAGGTLFLGKGAWRPVWRSMCLHSWLYMALLLMRSGSRSVGFAVLREAPALLLGWSVCALAYGLLGGASRRSPDRKLLYYVGWAAMLWPPGYYLLLLASAF